MNKNGIFENFKSMYCNIFIGVGDCKQTQGIQKPMEVQATGFQAKNRLNSRHYSAIKTDKKTVQANSLK